MVTLHLHVISLVARLDLQLLVLLDARGPVQVDVGNLGRVAPAERALRFFTEGFHLRHLHVGVFAGRGWCGEGISSQ